MENYPEDLETRKKAAETMTRMALLISATVRNEVAHRDWVAAEALGSVASTMAAYAYAIRPADGPVFSDN